MRGTNARLTPLNERKELLVLESEINRAELGREWRELRADATDLTRNLTADANALGSLASAGAALFTTGSALRRLSSNRATSNGSWVQTLRPRVR